MLLDRLHHDLEVVLGLARDPDLVALDVALDLDLQALHELDELASLLLGDPDVQVDRLPRRSLGGGLDRPEVQRLERDLAPNGLLLQDLHSRLEPVLRRGADLDQLVVLADAGPGVLEVEPLRDLAPSLVDGVRDLGHRDLGDDVEREVLLGHAAILPWRCRSSVAILPRTGGCPSGQRERSVKSPAKPTEVRILLLPGGARRSHRGSAHQAGVLTQHSRRPRNASRSPVPARQRRQSYLSTFGLILSRP